MLYPTSSRYLFKLHARIALRYLRLMHKEIAGLIILFVALETASAGDLERSFPSVILATGLATTIAVQLLRRDKHFLRISIPHYRSFLLKENLLLILPFAAILLAFREWSPSAILIVLAIAISFVDTWRTRKLKFGLTSLLPASAFEWMAGTRKTAPLLIVLYVVTALLNDVGAVPLLCMLVLARITVSFYFVCESELILSAMTTQRHFLLWKIGQGVGLYLALAMPFILLAFYRIHGHWYVIPIAGIFAMLSISGAVLLKYAYFEQGRDLSVRNDIRSTLLMASFLVLPVMLIYEFNLFRRARQTLAARR